MSYVFLTQFTFRFTQEISFSSVVSTNYLLFAFIQKNLNMVNVQIELQVRMTILHI